LRTSTIGRGHRHVKVGPAVVALLHHVVEADELRAGRLGGFGGGAGLGEDEHADVLAAAVGQRNRAANHLVALLGIHAEFEGEVNGLIELGLGELGEGFDGRLERQVLAGVDQLEGFVESFAWHLMVRCMRAARLSRVVC
jgi:hypothetical protein